MVLDLIADPFRFCLDMATSVKAGVVALASL